MIPGFKLALKLNKRASRQHLAERGRMAVARIEEIEQGFSARYSRQCSLSGMVV